MSAKLEPGRDFDKDLPGFRKLDLLLRQDWRKKMRRQAQILTLCTMLLSTFTGLTPIVKAAPDINRGYDWTVNVETEQLERYFEYRNSNLRPFDRTTVQYYPGDNETMSRAYEKLWFHDGKPLGLERAQPFGVTRGENICLKVKHHSGKPTPGEMKAAANTILRIWLDAYVNKNQLVVVKVPNGQSLHGIADELLAKQNFQLMPDSNAEKPVNSTMTLTIVSEEDGQKVNLAYL